MWMRCFRVLKKVLIDFTKLSFSAIEKNDVGEAIAGVTVLGNVEKV